MLPLNHDGQYRSIMTKIRAVTGLVTAIALILLFAIFKERNGDPALEESDANTEVISEDNLSIAAAHFDSDDDVKLPDDWESVTVADCAHLAPPAAIEQAAIINPYDWTAQQLCAWMLANSEELTSKMEKAQQRNSNEFEAQFPAGAFDSPYEGFSTAELELAAPNDGVASYVLAMRLEYVDRERSDELFIQSAMQTGLPGPLMAAVYSRNGVDLVRDPDNGSVVYADPDDVFKAAVLAMTVKYMGYDFHQAGFFMEHVARAMGPESVDMVISESERLYEQISRQPAARE